MEKLVAMEGYEDFVDTGVQPSLLVPILLLIPSATHNWEGSSICQAAKPGCNWKKLEQTIISIGRGGGERG